MPEAVAANRWLTEVYEPAVDAIPPRAARAGWTRRRSSTRSWSTAGSCPRRPAATSAPRPPREDYFARVLPAGARGPGHPAGARTRTAAMTAVSRRRPASTSPPRPAGSTTRSASPGTEGGDGGRYELFFQYNPHGRRSGHRRATGGRPTSRDLVRWERRGPRWRRRRRRPAAGRARSSSRTGRRSSSTPACGAEDPGVGRIALAPGTPAWGAGRPEPGARCSAPPPGRVSPTCVTRSSGGPDDEWRMVGRRRGTAGRPGRCSTPRPT